MIAAIRGTLYPRFLMNKIILTLIGPDATGIVAGLAAMVEKNGGNWLDSRMMRLEGTFSGILSIEIPPSSLPAFRSEVEGFMHAGDFQFSLQPAKPVKALPASQKARLDLSGHDHPGIVHRIFTAFQKRGVNVEELSTSLEAEPWSGTLIFKAQARLGVPETVTLDQLQADLENLASDLLVDVQLAGDAG